MTTHNKSINVKGHFTVINHPSRNRGLSKGHQITIHIPKQLVEETRPLLTLYGNSQTYTINAKINRLSRNQFVIAPWKGSETVDHEKIYSSHKKNKTMKGVFTKIQAKGKNKTRCARMCDVPCVVALLAVICNRVQSLSCLQRLLPFGPLRLHRCWLCARELNRIVVAVQLSGRIIEKGNPYPFSLSEQGATVLCLL